MMVGILQDDEEQTNSLRRNKMNKMMKWSLAVACAVISTGSVMAQGDGGPLIDALVKKGVLSSQEGEEIRADMTADLASTPGGMISWGSSAVRGVRIYGDTRFRYEYNSIRDQVTPPGSDSRQTEDHRYRYRLRIGADYTFASNFNAGVRLETQADSTSTNTDLGGFFDKNGDAINIGLAFLSYANTDVWGIFDTVRLTAGKQISPLYFNGVNGFLWDTDANPEGFSQELGWKDVGFDKLDIAFRSGQYIVSNVNNSAVPAAAGIGGNATDAWMATAQVEAKYDWATRSGFKIAPTFIGIQGDETGTQANSSVLRQSLSNDAYFLIPAEVYFNVLKQPLRLYGTYGLNLNGEGRNHLATGERFNSSKNQLFNVGATLGNARNKGSWDITGEYRYVETNAYTRNLQDSDFNGGRGNGHGFVGSFGYAVTDNVQLRASYFHSMNIDKTQGTFPAPTGGTNASIAQVLQIDLSWRF